MKNAIIYARYSSEKQNDQSIEGQLRICNQYAQENGLTIVDTYIDRATTGTNDNRAAFQQMLADSAKPVPWDIVLVYAIDRFGRNSIEIAVNKQKLKKNHKTFISATQRTSENIDGSKNLDGILLENMYIGLAEYYSAELSQKVLRGLHENRVKGYFCGGQVAYGYRVENKKVIIDEDTAKVVLSIFQQYASGRIAKDIIKDLTAQGVLHHGKPFAMNTFYYMLRLEKYIGISRHSDGVYNNIYPPIVPTALFQEVQGILAKNKIGSRSAYTDFLLRNILICGYCGKHLQGESGTARNGEKKHYYKCMGRKKLNNCDKTILPKDKLENLIVTATIDVMSAEKNISFIADEVMKAHAERMHDKSLLNILSTERESIKKSLTNIMKAIEQGILTATTKTRVEELEQQLAETEDKILIEQYKAQNQITREQVIEYLRHSIQQEPTLMIKTLIQKIVLYDDRAEIYYNYTEHMTPDGKDNPDCRDSSLPRGSDFTQPVAPVNSRSSYRTAYSFNCKGT